VKEVVEIQVDAPHNKYGGSSRTLTLRLTIQTIARHQDHQNGRIFNRNVEAGISSALIRKSGSITPLGPFVYGQADATGPSTRFVQCPEGELQKQREVRLHVLSLHEIDEVNSRSQGFLALLPGTLEKDEVRAD
jgi:RuvB-like protein 2